MKNNIHFKSYLFHFLLEREMFQTKFVEKIRINNFKNIVLFMRECGKIL